MQTVAVVGGAETKGALAAVLCGLTPHVPGAGIAMVPGAGHWIFEQPPVKFSEIVLEFLG